MSFAMRPLIGFLTTVLLASQAFANASVTSSTTLVQQPKKQGRMWSGFVNASRSTSPYDFEDGTRQDAMDYMMRLNLKFNDKFSMRVQGGYSQDLKYPENNDFSDTSVSLGRAPMALGKTIMLGYRVATGLPTSKDSHTRQNLIASVSTTVNGMINPDRLISGLDIAGSISAGRNFHQYETALDGRVNTQWTSSQMFSMAYTFTTGISVSAEFLHRNTWSYQNVMRDTFEMTQEIGYEINSTFSIAAGHTNSGSSLKPNGDDSNVQLINENTSLVYASATVVF
ncbi:hypothetical protein ACLWBD_13935 [Bdellovibrio sp. HCB117]|uniref:hypothetical protein n=1 Tax=Bdellovibrio sp. HCB117 TaxID=3394359 RepID=UPI0039B4495F